MLSGRAIIALGLVGFGVYVLRKGVAVASSIAAPVNGLGADPDPAQAALDAQVAQGQAVIDAINAISTTPPPMPVVGPKRIT